MSGAQMHVRQCDLTSQWAIDSVHLRYSMCRLAKFQRTECTKGGAFTYIRELIGPPTTVGITAQS